jgi:hypothetical protein
MMEFRPVENLGKKTKRWTIHNFKGELLGWVFFHAPWRNYVWQSAEGIIFDVKCTGIIQDFLNAHKGDRQDV